MNILITGGAGFLGINLIRYLLKRNHNIISIDINDFDYDDVKNKITHLKGDIRDKEFLNKVINQVDIIIHCAAALPLYNKKDIFSTDVDGTLNLLIQAKMKNVKRFIHISSTAVYGIPNRHPILETDELNGVGNYGKAKIEAEKICLKFRNEGLCVPILRPKSFIGPERLGVFALLYDWAKDGKNFPLIGKGNNKYQLLDVEDLCDAINLCITLPEKIVNDTFNIGARIYSTMKEDYQAVLDFAGHGKKIISLPVLPVVLSLKFLEKLKLSPLYKWIYETASKDSFVSIEKAEKILGFSPKFSNKDALIRNYQWYLENYNSFKGKKGINHRVSWNQGILKLAKVFF